MKCWECEIETEVIHHHHVVPQSRGGTKTVPLCISCHSKAHHIEMNMHHRTLIMEGIQRAKEKGVRFGSPRHHEARAIANKVRAANSERYIARTMVAIREIQATGITTQSGIARCLNARGMRTSRGKPFTQPLVRYVIKTYEKLHGTNELFTM